MESKKGFVQVYGHCVEDGVVVILPKHGPKTTRILTSTIRRVAVYSTFNQLCQEGVSSIFHTHLGVKKSMEQFWDQFCWILEERSGFSRTCGQKEHHVNKCACDFSMVLPLVEVWTKTGKYFVAGEDRFQFVERE